MRSVPFTLPLHHDLNSWNASIKNTYNTQANCILLRFQVSWIVNRLFIPASASKWHVNLAREASFILAKDFSWNWAVWLLETAWQLLEEKRAVCICNTCVSQESQHVYGLPYMNINGTLFALSSLFLSQSSIYALQRKQAIVSMTLQFLQAPTRVASIQHQPCQSQSEFCRRSHDSSFTYFVM